MNPPCARCSKTVYPVEKLNCLDKCWHKKCFTCEVCNMKLTMKNYKGYNKNPYCNAHYPTTKFTTVADTPENKRLAQNTQNQSRIKYHEEYEKDKGHYTAVSDDPETERAKQAAKNASQVMYTADSRQPANINRGAGRHGSQSDYGAGYEPPSSDQYRQQVAPAVLPPAQPAAPIPPAQPQQPRYRALYDYTAADNDEVSMEEGDIIVDSNIIDSGWMEGRNERTGQFGMLPSNYVEEV